MATEVQDDFLEPLVEVRLLGLTGRRTKKESMALLYFFELTMMVFLPSVLQENARKRESEVRILIQREQVLVFFTVLKQVKQFNNPLPDGSSRSVWVRTALPDRQVPAELRPAQHKLPLKLGIVG